MRAIKNMIVVIGKSDATDQVKKAMLMSVGGKDMVFLFDHAGKKAEECFACGLSEQFKGAPMCKGGGEKENGGKIRQVKQKEEKEEDSETSASDVETTCRVRERVAASRDDTKDPMVQM